MKRIITLTVATLIVLFTSNAIAAGVEIAVGGWRQAISGELSYKASSEINDTIDLDNDMNFDDESRVTGRAKIDMPLFLPNIYLMAAPMEFEGTGTKSVSFTFGDSTFDANADLNSKITLNQYDVAFYYGLPFIKTGTLGKLNVDVGLNVRIVDLKATVSGASSGVTVEESESVTLPVPMLYVAAQFSPIDALSFEAEGRGLSVGGNKFYSLIGRVRYNFAGPVFLAGGYRYDKIDVDEDELIADVDFQGPFVEMGLKF